MSSRIEAPVEEIVTEVHEELERLAQRLMNHERAAHTLEPSALVNETYLKLRNHQMTGFNDRQHFLAIAARAMRQILVSHAERRNAAKRGGDWGRVEMDGVVDLFEDRSSDVVAVDEALLQLAAIDPTQAKLVELRFFGGLTMPEIANTLGLSQRTVEREWSLARAWLRRALQSDSESRERTHDSVATRQRGLLRSA